MPPRKVVVAPPKKKARESREGALYLRADPGLLVQLDRWADELRDERPGNSISRADVVREILYTAMRQRWGTPKAGK